MESPQELVLLLKHHSKERTILRKKLFKFLRRNRHIECIRTDFWINRKMDRNWLSDLSDKKLLEYCERILN